MKTRQSKERIDITFIEENECENIQFNEKLSR